jgi:2-polyprenyl-3-methyl-5-hydroxy-6-metoxy-1,4-benzoquinol methylase
MGAVYNRSRRWPIVGLGGGPFHLIGAKMASHVCPWWGGYFIDNPLRRWLHNPEQILGPYVRPGMTVVDLGCGMGMFSIAMARMVGPQGRVIVVDLQQQMLDVLMERARKAGQADRIEPHRAEAERIGLDAAGTVDFALAFAMVHEVPDTPVFLAQVAELLKRGGKFFVAEPRLHVPDRAFDAMVAMACPLGLAPVEEPRVCCCRAVVFGRAGIAD